jgi:hypothetical protein
LQIVSRLVRRENGTSAEETAGLPPARTVRLPADWGEVLDTGFRGRVQCRRGFGCPSGLSPNDAVQLVIQPADSLEHAWLNDRPLTSEATGVADARFEIRSLLLPRNLLIAEFLLAARSSAPPDGPGGEPSGDAPCFRGMLTDAWLEISRPTD